MILIKKLYQKELFVYINNYNVSFPLNPFINHIQEIEWIELNQYRGYYNNINSKIFLKIRTYIQIILIII